MNSIKLTEKEKNIIVRSIKNNPLNMAAAAREAKIPFSSFIRRAKKLNIYKPNPGQPEARKTYQGTLEWETCSMQEKRRRIMKEQNNCCLWCSLVLWRETKIILELDHIDGNRKNNTRKNLRFLCPNCHSQTPTFRNQKKRKKPCILDKDLIYALRNNKSIRQALLSVNLVDKGGNYKRAQKLIKENNINMPIYHTNKI